MKNLMHIDFHLDSCASRYGASFCDCGVLERESISSVDEDIKQAEINLSDKPSDFWPGFFLGAMCAIFWGLVIWGLS